MFPQRNQVVPVRTIAQNVLMLKEQFFNYSCISIVAIKLPSSNISQISEGCYVFFPGYFHGPGIEESSAAYSYTRHRVAFSLSAV